MVKICIISDIHGNLFALKAILKKINVENYDYIYFLGDVIAIGPFPKECVEMILKLQNAKYILGNHEEYFISNGEKCSFHTMSEGEKNHQQWVASLLNEKIRDEIKKLPYVIYETIQGVSVAFLHYALNNDKSINTFKNIEKNISCESLDTLFDGINADLIFYGHDHLPSNVKGKKHYVNVGTSGCTKSNYTHYTTVIFENNNYDIITNYIEYKKDQLLKELFNKNIPEKEFILKCFFNCNL